MQYTEDFESPERSRVGELGLLIQLTAFSIASSLLLLSLPSIETISFSVFLAGIIFRPKFSFKLMMATVITWEITVTMVLGFSGVIFPFKVLAWTVVLSLGHLSRKLKLSRPIEFLIVGALSGLIWDLIVLLALPLSAGTQETYTALLIPSFILGIPFTFLHVIGNAALFSTIPVVLKGISPPLKHNYKELLAP